MKIDEMIATLDAPGLATLRVNADRLSEHGTPKQKEKAAEALLLIEAEQARRAEIAGSAPSRRRPAEARKSKR